MPRFNTISAVLDNPVFRREMTARWRHPAAFILVAVYGLAIALAVAWQVYEIPANNELPPQLGHEIWSSLTITQVLGWVLLGPSLTAASLAGEREGGHLEALMLSPLSVRDIVYGKFYGALSLALLLLLVPLPAVALCFLLGGLSPAEFLFGFLIELAVALLGLGFGMNASASCRHTAHAIPRALGTALLGHGMMLVAQVFICCLPGLISPFLSLLWLQEMRHGLGPLQIAQCFGCLVVQIAVTRRQLNGAMQTIVRPLPEAMRPAIPLEQELPYTAVPGTLANSFANTAPTPARRVPALANPRWLSFANPVLQREARSRLRFVIGDDRALNDMALGCSTLGYFIYIVPITLIAWFDPRRREEMWWLVAYPWLFCMIAMAVLTSAGVLTRERESGHWPLLWLTPLRRGEILGGKIGGVFLGAAYWSLWLLPFWLPCFFGVPFITLAATFAVAFSATWLAANIGLFWSAVFHKTALALNWSIVCLLIWCFTLPPWQAWVRVPYWPAAWRMAVIYLIVGELLYLLTHRILYDAPRER